jgi:glycosyltransferase involved in cell wall biosynthesis
MAAADVFCLPSYSEGCPNVVIEALACGRPVVATKVGGIPELVGSACGLLVPPRDSRSLSCALAEALARRWDAQSIAQRFSRPWERVAEETIQVCYEVLGAPR